MKPAQSSEAFWLDNRLPLAITFPFLALLIPFTVYLSQRNYPLMSVEILPILAGMVCVSTVIGLIRWAGGRLMYAICVSGLLTVAADYLFDWIAHSHTITLLVIFGVLVVLVRRLEKTMTLTVTVFLGVFVISPFMRNGFEGESSPVLAVPQTVAMTNGLPRLIHLILDEHLGVEGIPDDTDYGKELKHKIKQFYQRYGFALYGGAYSYYYDTIDSIPNLVNFSAENGNGVYATSEHAPYPLRQNRYFQFLKNEGYQIHVLDGNFIDFCSSPDVPPQSCTKYQWNTWGKVAKLDLPPLTKTTMLLATFVASYTRYQSVLNLYEQRMRPLLLSQGVVIPMVDRESFWTRRRFYPFAVNAMGAMEAVSANLLQLTPGHMLFAHLLVPHHAYVYREDCSPREISESLGNMDLLPLELRTTEDRELRFNQYLRQVECLYTKLDELFRRMQSSGVFDDSIIIVHGDHGSRLGLRQPRLKEQNQLTPADYADALSTLFAARIPGKSGGYDPALHPINELFVQTLGNSLGKVPSTSAPRREPFTYLYDERRKQLVLVDMPWRPKNLPDSHAAVQ